MIGVWARIPTATKISQYLQGLRISSEKLCPLRFQLYRSPPLPSVSCPFGRPASARLTNPRVRFGRDIVAPLGFHSRMSDVGGPASLRSLRLPVPWWKLDGFASFWKRWASLGKPTRVRVGSQKRGGGAGSWDRCSRVLWRREEQVPSTFRAAALEGLRAP